MARLLHLHPVSPLTTISAVRSMCVMPIPRQRTRAAFALPRARPSSEDRIRFSSTVILEDGCFLLEIAVPPFARRYSQLVVSCRERHASASGRTRPTIMYNVGFCPRLRPRCQRSRPADLDGTSRTTFAPCTPSRDAPPKAEGRRVAGPHMWAESIRTPVLGVVAGSRYSPRDWG